MKLRKEIQVGILTIAAVAALLFGLSYLSGRSVMASQHYYSAVYSNVNGLREGSPVLYHGYKVGQVRTMEFRAENGSIKVSFDVPAELNLRKDTKATIVSLDLLGAMGVELNDGISSEYANTGDLLPDSVAQGMFASFTPTLQKVDTAITSLNLLLAELQATTSGRDDRLNRIMQNVEATTGHLATGSQRFNSALGDVKALLAKVYGVVDSLDRSGDLPRITRNLATLTDSLNARTTQLGPVLAEAEQALAHLAAVSRKLDEGQGTAGALVNERELHDSLVSVSNSLNLLLEDLRANPKRYVHFSVFGRKNKAE